MLIGEEGAMVGRANRTVLATTAALGLVVLSAVEAEAGGFYIHEQSAYFQGTSFAGTAAGGPSLSAMFWNPATITQHGPGLSFEGDATFIAPRTEITPTTATLGPFNLVPLGGASDIGTNAFVPASYVVYGLTDRISLGLALNGPFGLNTKAPALWAGMFYNRDSDVFSLNANPSVAIRVADWLSVGVGAQVQYMRVKLTAATPFSGTFPPFGPLSPDTGVLQGDSIDFGLTAGITITPTPWTTIGLGYRSRIDQSLEGYVWRPGLHLPPLLTPVPPAYVGISATVPLPDIATASIRQKITETFTLLGTVEWTNWSRLGTFPVVADTPTPFIPTALSFEWRDGWMFSGGAEYQWRPNLAVRAGVGFERSPIDDRVRGLRLPDNDRLWVSAGLTYNWNERLSFDLGYSHIFVDDTPINIVSGNPNFDVNGGASGTFTGNADSQVNIVSFAFRYRFLPPAPAAIVTKG
jgi:long-chain fatty acid transport protein